MIVNCIDWWSGDTANFLYGVQVRLFSLRRTIEKRPNIDLLIKNIEKTPQMVLCNWQSSNMLAAATIMGNLAGIQ